MVRFRIPPVRRVLTFGVTILLLAGGSGPASAQDPGPIGPYVVDARGSFVSVGQVTELATNRGLHPGQLSAWGLGLDVGAHVYVFKWRGITFGLGASALFAAPSKTLENDEQGSYGPTVKTRFTAVSPQLSFNFGDGDGWSYLSGGLGTSRMTVYEDQPTLPEQRSAGTLNYGGGARWFVRPGLALSLDIRIFAISPLAATDTKPGSPRMTRMAFNIGASFN